MSTGTPPPESQEPYGQPGYGQPDFGPPDHLPGYAHPDHGIPAIPPENWLISSILSTAFCCFPLGVAGIVFAAQVNTKWAAGDRAGAVVAARKARNFTLASVAVTLVLLGLAFLAAAVDGSLDGG